MKKSIHRPFYRLLPLLLVLPVFAGPAYAWSRWGHIVLQGIQTGLKAGLIP